MPVGMDACIGAGVDEIIAIRGYDHVMPRAGDNGCVSVGAGEELVVARSAVHRIIAGAAADRVIAAAHRDPVIAAAAVDMVIAVAGGDVIGAAAAEDRVVAVSTDDGRGQHDVLGDDDHIIAGVGAVDLNAGDVTEGELFCLGAGDVGDDVFAVVAEIRPHVRGRIGICGQDQDVAGQVDRGRRHILPAFQSLKRRPKIRGAGLWRGRRIAACGEFRALFLAAPLRRFCAGSRRVRLFRIIRQNLRGRLARSSIIRRPGGSRRLFGRKTKCRSSSGVLHVTRIGQILRCLCRANYLYRPKLLSFGAKKDASIGTSQLVRISLRPRKHPPRAAPDAYGPSKYR